MSVTTKAADQVSEMDMKKLCVGMLCLTGLMGHIAMARPVTYTLSTVSDGALGSLTFAEARVSITFVGDTRNVVATTEGGATVYTNSKGTATVTVTQGFTSTVAHFAPGQIYVRYDVTRGIVGFGSTASATYPLALGCYYGTCSAGIVTDGAYYEDGIAAVLADVRANPADASLNTPAVLAQQATLSSSTLVTGGTSACVQDYDSLAHCDATSPLATDQGAFSLQDLAAQANNGVFRAVVTND